MKKWLSEYNEEGISNGDAIYMGVGVLFATVLLAILYKIFG